MQQVKETAGVLARSQVEKGESISLMWIHPCRHRV